MISNYIGARNVGRLRVVLIGKEKWLTMGVNQNKQEFTMSKTISTIYNSVSTFVPFYPNVEYRRSTRGVVESELDNDAMFLKINLKVSYEQALNWLMGKSDRFDRFDCVKAMKKGLAEKGKKVRNQLADICQRYSLAA